MSTPAIAVRPLNVAARNRMYARMASVRRLVSDPIGVVWLLSLIRRFLSPRDMRTGASTCKRHHRGIDPVPLTPYRGRTLGESHGRLGRQVEARADTAVSL